MRYKQGYHARIGDRTLVVSSWRCSRTKIIYVNNSGKGGLLKIWFFLSQRTRRITISWQCCLANKILHEHSFMQPTKGLFLPWISNDLIYICWYILVYIQEEVEEEKKPILEASSGLLLSRHILCGLFSYPASGKMPFPPNPTAFATRPDIFFGGSHKSGLVVSVGHHDFVLLIKFEF